MSARRPHAGTESPKKAVLAIDLGSTSTRAYLYDPESGAGWPVLNSRRHDRGVRYEAGDFSSLGYPFEGDGPVYRGESSDVNRQSTSLKYAFYPLAGAKDELVEQYPLVEPLWARRKDWRFLSRLRQGLVELFTVISQHVRHVCDKRRLVIADIALSIPAQWTLDFEDVYRSIIADVFNHPSSNIHFHTETESLARYLLSDHMGELEVDNDCNVVLFLDFGGHNMNGCLFDIVCAEDGTKSFIRIGEAFGAGGGSEQWEYYIGNICAEKAKKLLGYSLPVKGKQELLDQFNIQKRNISSEASSSMPLVFAMPEGKYWQLILDPKDINECLSRALRGPLKLAEERIQHAAATSKPRIVVSGGTLRNKGLQARLVKMCQDASLPSPVFTDTMDLPYETNKIAQGAAYACSDPTTVEDFIRRGAAFGLHKKQGSPRGGNSQRLWDDEALLLYTQLDKSCEGWHYDKATGLDELKLVCDPHFSSAEDSKLHWSRMYDILDLGIPKRGTWYYSITMTGKKDNMKMVLRRTYQDTMSGHGAGEPVSYENVLPLIYDRGSGCLQIGVAGKSFDELGIQVKTGREDDNKRQKVAESIRCKGPEPCKGSASAADKSAGKPGVKPSGSLRNRARVDPSQRRQHPYRRSSMPLRYS